MNLATNTVILLVMRFFEISKVRSLVSHTSYCMPCGLESRQVKVLTKRLSLESLCSKGQQVPKFKLDKHALASPNLCS